MSSGPLEKSLSQILMRCFLTVNRAVLSTLFLFAYGALIDGIAFFCLSGSRASCAGGTISITAESYDLQVGDVTFFLPSTVEALSLSCLPPCHVIGVVERLGEVFA